MENVFTNQHSLNVLGWIPLLFHFIFSSVVFFDQGGWESCLCIWEKVRAAPIEVSGTCLLYLVMWEYQWRLHYEKVGLMFDSSITRGGGRTNKTLGETIEKDLSLYNFTKNTVEIWKEYSWKEYYFLNDNLIDVYYTWHRSAIYR